MSSNMLGKDDVVKALIEAGHSGDIYSFSRNTESAQAAAKELDVPVQRIIKSMVFSVDRAPVLVLLPGDRKADYSSISELLGARKVRLAFPEQVVKWTGFPVGAVPPLGHSSPITVILDDDIERECSIYPAAGEKNNAFETNFDDLVSMTSGSVMSISAREKE